MCHHTQEPTVLSRVSCRPFHLNALTVIWAHSKNSEDCHPRTTTSLAGKQVFPLCALEVLRRYQRLDVDSFLPYRGHPRPKCGHTNKFGTRALRRLSNTCHCFAFLPCFSRSFSTAAVGLNMCDFAPCEIWAFFGPPVFSVFFDPCDIMPFFGALP